MSEQPSSSTGHENPVRAAPPLSDSERIGFGTAAFIAFGVSALGLLSSYTSLSSKAMAWGWSWPWLLPVGVDLAIPAFTGASLYLIRTNMPLAWVAAVPRLLTAATVYLNWSAGRTTAGRIGHAVLILLWVAFSEIAGHIYATRIGAVTGARMEKVRRARWLLAPISTAVLQRRMILWEITSYSQALRLERDRLLLRAGFREKFGRGWRWKAPLRERVLLRLGELVPANLAAGVRNRSGASSEPVLVPAGGTPEPAAANHVPNAPEPQAPGTNLTRATARRTGSTSKPKSQRNPTEPGTATPSVGEQVRQILDLIETHGYDTVKLGFVQEQTGMSKTTAYNRLIEARTAWAEGHGEAE